MRKLTAYLLVFGLATIGFGVLHHGTAFADYNSSNLISDPVFSDSGSMSTGDIQSFLASRSSGLAGFQDTENCGDPSGTHYSFYSTYYSCGQPALASKIIYDTAQAYHISPRVILATLQKEQSLVTTPNPTASQIQCAMGYQSCSSKYLGFFTQLDNAAWQLRTYNELMNGKNWWGYVPSQYPCSDSAAGIPSHDPSGNNHLFYYPGLYPGRNVTFYDYYGDAYANFSIANAATAGLYCYTPHVYPGSASQYYSGSYNFVYWFEHWFGSTQNIVARYNWTLTGQTAYTNSTRTTAYSDGNVSVTPGGKAYLRVQARNNGNTTWSKSSIRLGTSNPRDRASIFSDASWLSNSRISLVEDSVLPGDVGTFDFSITAPQTTGTYNEYFNIVWEGVTWLNDIGLYYQIDVVNPTTATNTQSTGLTSGQTLSPGNYLLSPDTQSTLNVQGDGNLVLYSNFKPIWSSKTSSSKRTMLLMQPDGNLVLYDSSMFALWASGTSGNPGARVVTQTDGNLVVYSSNNTPLWATYTLSTPDHLSRVNKVLPAGTNLFVGQTLDTANRKYKLSMQLDGNLVLYDGSRAIWSSGTVGKPVAFASMQADGNLVVYGTNGQALWYSGATGGRADLVIQSDGNLVSYRSPTEATWATNTSGQ